jgi:hypothetical protein
MKSDHYELLRRQAEEDLERGVEVLRAAHRERLKAIEVLRLVGGNGDLPSVPSGQPEPRRRRGALLKEMDRILERLEDQFEGPKVDDVAAALSIATSRAARARVLRQMEDEGKIVKVEEGQGTKPDVYRKVKPAGA